jgi:hypothetical protein
MVQHVSAEKIAAISSRRAGVATSMVVASAAVIGVALMIGAAVLWVHYGTAVFFEMIASGIAACI